MPETQKIVITRDIGEQALSILEQERADVSFHVSFPIPSSVILLTIVLGQLQIWSGPAPADRAWLLHHVQGATGLLVMFSDKVNGFFVLELRHTDVVSCRSMTSYLMQVCEAICSFPRLLHCAAGPSLKVIATMSVGYGV